jgi:hypothetical protein
MKVDTLTCPNCRTSIPISDALSKQIEANLRVQVEKEIGAKAKAEAAESIELELTTLRDQLAASEKKGKEARQTELALLRQKAELEKQKEDLELEVARKLNEERGKIREAAAIKAEQQHEQKDREKDKRLEDVLKQVEELKRKVEQGSQQLQGEVREEALKELLISSFPMDRIEDVPKGVRGADLIQRVMTRSGQECGIIVWESKQTKAWSDTWIPKLKSDCHAAGGHVAVLLSAVLPPGVRDFDSRDGVWIGDPKLAACLAAALRASLENVHLAKTAESGKQDKAGYVYAYLTSPGFKGHIEAIVESFSSMKLELEAERRVMTKAWAKRETHLTHVIARTATMYGDIHGIIGASLPEIESLEMETLPAPKAAVRARLNKG